MSITAPQHRLLQLKEIVDRHQTAGEIRQSMLVSESTHEIQHLANALFSLAGFLTALETAHHYTPVDAHPKHVHALSSSQCHRITQFGTPEDIKILLHDHAKPLSQHARIVAPDPTPGAIYQCISS